MNTSRWEGCSSIVTCSAPISFKGRLRTSEFVYLTRMMLENTASYFSKSLARWGWTINIPRRFIEYVAKVPLLLNKVFDTFSCLFCRLHQFHAVWRGTANLVYTRPGGAAECNEGRVATTFELPQDDIDGRWDCAAWMLSAQNLRCWLYRQRAHLMNRSHSTWKVIFSLNSGLTFSLTFASSCPLRKLNGLCVDGMQHLPRMPCSDNSLQCWWARRSVWEAPDQPGSLLTCAMWQEVGAYHVFSVEISRKREKSNHLFSATRTSSKTKPRQ